MAIEENQKKFTPSKKLGQNFLQDKNILGKIISLGNLEKNKDHVVEIGPGLGALTKLLAENSKTVYAIEKDTRVLVYLKKNLENYSNIELINKDVLDINFSSLVCNTKLKLIANLPYNISTPILLKIYNERDLFSQIIVMLQKEVGERICSEKNTKSYGSLSIIFQNYFDTKINFIVPPEAFKPKPKVDSVVISMVPLLKPRFEVSDEIFFQTFLKTAFSSRRKMLRNSLSNSFDIEIIDRALSNQRIS
ncbi:MAG: 16S rRNA (adenine(1518)-N(6)/adenine(1519)-N(6))-dimethyltransferase RsmA, partial [Thermodesulfobacteriota bacterium]